MSIDVEITFSKKKKKKDVEINNMIINTIDKFKHQVTAY